MIITRKAKRKGKFVNLLHVTVKPTPKGSLCAFRMIGKKRTFILYFSSLSKRFLVLLNYFACSSAPPQNALFCIPIKPVY